MTKQQTIKKYNLKTKKQDIFDKEHNIERWENTIENEDIKKIYILSNEFSRIVENKYSPFFLVIQTIYKNKLTRIGKTDSYRHKTITRAYIVA